MLQKFEVSAVHFELDDRLKKYVTKKLGSIDKYLSKKVKPSAHLEVHLTETKQNGQKNCVCLATMHLPHGTIRIEEGTGNMFAAVDIVQVKLKQQIEKYKESHTDAKRRRRLFARSRRAMA